MLELAEVVWVLGPLLVDDVEVPPACPVEVVPVSDWGITANPAKTTTTSTTAITATTVGLTALLFAITGQSRPNRQRVTDCIVRNGFLSIMRQLLMELASL